MEFRRYEKVHRLGKEEVDGILEGTCTIQEKLDGANASIWEHDGEIHIGSRSRDLTLAGDDFNGFGEYVQGHLGIQNYLRDNPTHRLYGEFLVRHSIAYPETCYKKFYLFDILAEDWLHPDTVHEIADKYGIERVQTFGTFENPTEEQIKELAGKSFIAPEGEGVVIKNPDFVNKFGDRVNAKVVTGKFLESNAITFGGNNKHSDTYWEMYVVHKFMTLARIQKIMNKLQPQIDKRLDYEHIPRITNTAYHDLLTEEIWSIAKKVHTINFKKLQKLATKKAVQIYKDILNDDVSIADNVQN